ncbi:MAG: hypothetical protein ACK5QX_05835 [bacterium]
MPQKPLRLFPESDFFFFGKIRERFDGHALITTPCQFAINNQIFRVLPALWIAKTSIFPVTTVGFIKAELLKLWLPEAYGSILNHQLLQILASRLRQQVIKTLKTGQNEEQEQKPHLN